VALSLKAYIALASASIKDANSTIAKCMKILIYSTHFAPEPTGIGKYSGEMASWLAARGHEVRVVSAPPHYPNWRIDAKYRGSGYRREQWQGVDVWRAPIWVPKSPGGLTRMLHPLSFAFTSFPLMLRQIFWRPNLVLTVAPAMVCAPSAWITARLSGARAWLHMQDFEVDLAIRMNLLPQALQQRLVLRMERSVLRRFDIVSSISRSMTERLLMKGVKQKRVQYFPNWVDVSHIKPRPTLGSYRYELGIPDDAVVVLFSGTLGGNQGLMVLPEAARLLQARTDVVLVICGDGLMKSKLNAASADLPNVRMIPLQPIERLSELLCMADIHLLPQRIEAADFVLPSKLSGMLASGRPVIATCLEGTDLYGVVAQCGLAVQSQDAAALANAICTLADDRESRLEFGRRARVYAESNFERDAILTRVFGPIDGMETSVADDAIA
jgi:colanic acid biosynthesis glycosyl transferase WcaI